MELVRSLSRYFAADDGKGSLIAASAGCCSMIGTRPLVTRMDMITFAIFCDPLVTLQLGRVIWGSELGSVINYWHGVL